MTQAAPARALIIGRIPSALAANLAECQVLDNRCISDSADWASFVPASLQQCKADLVLPIAVPPAPEARDFFLWLQAHPIATPTLAVLSCEAADEFLRTASEAADDFVLVPVGNQEFARRVGRLIGPFGRGLDGIQSRLSVGLGLAHLVGNDPVFLRILEQIPLAAKSDCPVVITGETGTGKELCARAIHHSSRRRALPFIPVDCATLPDHLFENELFGHARGAYTDAQRDQRGLVAMAEGGTLFLDEIDALSLGTQAKLLRFLQERAYKPLGADRYASADVNVLAATNRDLESLVHEGRFRPDLFFRVNVLRIHLTPLRQRRGDIGLLARHFVDSICDEGGIRRKTLSPAALGALLLQDWPGNVRELFNVIQRAVVFSPGNQILSAHVLPPPSAAAPTERGRTDCAGTFRHARTRAVEAFERVYVEDLLHKHRGNVTRAAREAEKDRRAFGRLIKKYQLHRTDF